MSRKVSVIIFCVTFGLVATHAHLSNGNSLIKHYGSDCGFSSPGINGLGQNTEGFIWIGSNTGLTRFDGCHFKTFPLARIKSVPYFTNCFVKPFGMTPDEYKNK